MSKLFRAFLFTFIFTTFNREFRIFGFDLRYLTVAMATFLLLCRLVQIAQGYGRDRSSEANKKFAFFDIAVFYGIVALSNLSWLWNDLPFNQEQFVNLIILNASNALFAGVLVLFRKELCRKVALRYSLVSLMIMVLSMIWVYVGMDLPAVFHNAEVRTLNSGENFTNLFGQSIRVAGFAEDANYASLFCAIGFALCFSYYNPWSLLQIFSAVVFAVGFGLSFSKTVTIGIVMAILMLVARGVISKSWKSFSWIASIAIALLGIVFLSQIPMLQKLDTTSTRFALWSIAQSVFMDNPVLGGGLSSARSAIDVVYGGLWYVQCHSTFWQVLAEHGLFALIVLVVIIARRYVICERWWQVFILTQFVALCLTSELMYQQIFVYVLVFMPLILSEGDVCCCEEGRLRQNEFFGNVADEDITKSISGRRGKDSNGQKGSFDSQLAGGRRRRTGLRTSCEQHVREV